MTQFRNVLTGLFTLWYVIGSAQDDSSKTSFSGYLKDIQGVYILEGPGVVVDNFLHNRLNFRWFPNKHWTIALEARNRLFFGEFVKLNPGYAELIDYNDHFDLSWIWLNDPSAVGHSILDRAFVEYSKGKFEARVGRQRINWGITTVWNPNDLFNAFNFFDWDYEERPGSDAIRLQYFTGFASRIELAAKMANSLDESVIAGLWKFNKWNYDVQILGGISNGDAVAGLGWAGYVKDLGFKGEVSYFHPYLNLSDTSGSVSLALGLDYSFKNGMYVQLGGLYNSLGSRSFEGINLLMYEPSAKNLYPFRHSLMVSSAYPITPLISSNLALLYSPGPNALYIGPGFTFSLKQNLDLDLIGQVFLSDTDTGYRSLVSVVFGRLKWSF